MKATGYLVMESCEEYEQALGLRTGADLPPGGILDWADRKNGARAMFGSHKEARSAIQRTEHYRLAYGRTDLPEKKLCRVVPIAAVTPNDLMSGRTKP
jgi:hypothetical protein